MADNIPFTPGSGGILAADDIGGVQYARTKIALGADGVIDGDVSSANPLPVSGPLTDTELRASAVPVSNADITTLSGTVVTHQGTAASTPPGQLAMAVRKDADTQSATDGQYTFLQVNQTGRLKVAGAPAIYTAVTGTITGNGQTVSADCTQVSNVMMYCTGTFSTVNCAFEGSIDGGSTWFGIQAIRSNANTIETTTGNLSAAPTYAWELSVNGLTNVRVRSTAYTSGTQTWRFAFGSYATEPIPGAQTHAVSQSGNWTVTTTTPTTTNATLNSAASTNGTVIKGSAGTIYNISASNINAAIRYLKIYNSATVSVGTTTPILTIAIPAGGFVNLTFGAHGFRCGTGICIGLTTGAADSDTGAVAASEIKVMVGYI